MTTGTIKKVVADRGFGFIAAEDAKEYFFHRGALDTSIDFDRLVGGERVDVRDRGEPQGPARGPGAVRLATCERPACLSGGPFHFARGSPPGRFSPASPDPTDRVPGLQPSEARDADRTERSHLIVRTAFVSTYPPRRCGIASFTHDLAAATGGREIVALHPPEQAVPYPIEVHHRIRRDELADYVAGRANAGCAASSVVSIQHEYGIWGGEDGAYVLDFVGRPPHSGGRHAPHGPAGPDRRPARGPVRAGRSRRGHRRHVAFRGGRSCATSTASIPSGCTSSRTACRTFRSSTPTAVKPASGWQDETSS